MMRSRVRRTVLGTTVASAVGLLLACAHDPSEQLLDARQAYTEVYASEANQLVPDRVYDARVALEAAEREFERDAGSDAERHLAYIAHRKALLAMTEGERRKHQEQLQEAEREREEVLISQRDEVRAQLDEQQRDLEGERFATAEQLEEMERRRQEELESLEERTREDLEELEATRREEMQQLEEQRRREHEELRGAIGDAARVEQNEQQELTITLDGVVLFETGESELLRPARSRLQTVAEALQQHAQDKPITIEGHTDSTGPDDLNRRLSRERAESVKQFLVRQGVDEERIETVGKGPDEPLVPNDSPTNRAMNRRVEITIGNGNGAGTR